jgi:hypothetical protein
VQSHGTNVAAPLTRVSTFLFANLDALKARKGSAPILEPATVPAIAHTPESVADACARLHDAVGADVPDTVFVIGCGLGAIFDAIDQANPAAEVVALEPDRTSARRFLQHRDWTAWIRSGRLSLFVGPEYPGVNAAWRPSVVPATVPLVLDPDLERQNPDAAQEAEAVVDRLVQEARANAHARRANSGRYLLHTLANAAAIAREGDVATLAHACAGMPAIIVGAGPSLDGRLPELAAVADRAVVIACAAAARPLMTSGISPRFIVAADPTEATAMHVSALLSPRTSWLVGEGSLHPTALTPFDRRTFVFSVGDHQPWPWLRSLGITRGQLATWGSAATSALDLALRLGCSPIVFAGLDFAFTAGRPYCRGTTFESQWSVWMGAGQTFDSICKQAINRWPLTLEQDAEGQMVRTAPHLVSFRNWMCQQIEAASHARFINATPGGILHHAFIEQSNLSDALARLPALDAKAIDAHVRDRHRATAPASPRLFAGIDALAASVSDGTLADWVEFSSQTIRPQTFLGALKSHEHAAWQRGVEHGTAKDSPLMVSR